MPLLVTAMRPITLEGQNTEITDCLLEHANFHTVHQCVFPIVFYTSLANYNSLWNLAFIHSISSLIVSADKAKCMVMSRDQKAGLFHSVRTDNSNFERGGEFKYLGTTLTNQNSIAEEIKSRLRSGNACSHSVQNLLSSRLLSKILKIKIYI